MKKIVFSLIQFFAMLQSNLFYFFWINVISFTKWKYPLKVGTWFFIQHWVEKIFSYDLLCNYPLQIWNFLTWTISFQIQTFRMNFPIFLPFVTLSIIVKMNFVHEHAKGQKDGNHCRCLCGCEFLNRIDLAPLCTWDFMGLLYRQIELSMSLVHPHGF